MRVRPFIIFIITILFNMPLAAAPSGAQLLKACEKALANGYQGMAASMCEWYVTPCDCKVLKPSRTPRVCLPDKISSKVLAHKVINGLKAEPELTGKSAAYAAAVILARSYPCPD